MKVSKLILWLEEVKKRSGDLEVTFSDGDIQDIIDGVHVGEYVYINGDHQQVEQVIVLS